LTISSGATSVAALGGAFAVAAAMTGVAAYAVHQRDVARDNERRATREAMKAERTAEFMVNLFEVADPGESRGRQVTAKEILDRGVASIEQDLAEEPGVQGALMHTMGRVYTGLGLYPEAARILSVARTKRADADDLFATENALARAEFEKGDLDAAKKIYVKLIAEADAAMAKGGWRVDYATALIGMGETTLYADTPEEAQRHYERARDLLSKHGMAESEQMAEALLGLGGAELFAEQYSRAEKNLKDSELLFNIVNRKKIVSSGVKNDIANLYYFTKRFDEAAVEFRAVYNDTARELGAVYKLIDARIDT
jgi:serine/threonine-protein kinase